MKKTTKTLFTASILSVVGTFAASDVSAMNPNLKAGFEKCYGVAKAGKNDCASKVGKHACSSMSKVDRDPNEWIKLPEGTCDKLAGGSLKPASEVTDKNPEGHGDHKH